MNTSISSRPQSSFWQLGWPTFLFSLFSLLGFFVLVFFNLSISEIEDFYINSDTLYQPSLYIDIIERQNDMARWHLNPSPNFFPDMGIYFLLMFVTGGHVLWSTFLFAMIQIVILDLLLLFLIRHLYPSKHFQLLIFGNLLFSLFSLTDLISGDSGFCFLLLSNSYHLGSFVATLIGINLMLSILKHRRTWKWIALSLICLLGYPSDKIFLISFVLPTFLFIMIKIIRSSEKQVFVLLLSDILGSTLLGWATLNFMIWNGNLFIEEPHSFLNFSNIIGSFKELSRQYVVFFERKNFITLILILSWLSLFLQLYLSIRNLIKKSGKDLFTLFFLINFAVIFAPILAGNYTGLDTIRYNFHGYLFSTLLLPLVLFEIRPNLIASTKLSFSILGFQGFIFIWLLVFIPQKPSNYFEYYPAIARAADDFAEKTQKYCGTAQYWHAKVITLFSQKGVLVVPTFSPLLPYDHATTKDQFSRHPVQKTTPHFYFSIIDENERLQSLENLFGPDQITIYNIDGYTFAKHPPYEYKKDSYVIYLVAEH